MVRAIALSLVLCTGCSIPPLVSGPVARPDGSSAVRKLDANLADIYFTWLHCRGSRELARRWARRGAYCESNCPPPPTSEEMRQIDAARVVLHPVVSVHVYLDQTADAAALEAMGFRFWMPAEEPYRVFFDDIGREVIVRYIRELRLADIERLTAHRGVILVGHAPVELMRAYREPDLE